MKELHPPAPARNPQNSRNPPKQTQTPRSQILSEPVRIGLGRNVWRLTYEDYQGSRRVNWRQWFYNQDGELCATRNGLILQEHHLLELSNALAALARDIANDNNG